MFNESENKKVETDKAKNCKTDFKILTLSRIALIVLVAFCALSAETSTVNVFCSGPAFMPSCYLDKDAAIETKDLRISASHRKDAIPISFSHNKKVKYLPVFMQETFPFLREIHARSCSIQEICKENFVGLRALNVIYLDNNEIERIASETFNGLYSLYRVELGNLTAASGMTGFLGDVQKFRDFFTVLGNFYKVSRPERRSRNLTRSDSKTF